MNQREQFIVATKNTLNTLYGIPKTPEEVAVRCVDLCRAMGKTRTLIEALPEDGMAVVVLHKLEYKQHLVDQIRCVRGKDYPVSNLIFISHGLVKSGSLDRVRGVSPRPVFIDNAVIDVIQLEIVSWMTNQIFFP